MLTKLTVVATIASVGVAYGGTRALGEAARARFELGATQQRAAGAHAGP